MGPGCQAPFGLGSPLEAKVGAAIVRAETARGLPDDVMMRAVVAALRGKVRQVVVVTGRPAPPSGLAGRLLEVAGPAIVTVVLPADMADTGWLQAMPAATVRHAAR
jgi:hypothetical protein